nr:recombinase family protein [Bartonella alsatica]
MVLLDYGRVSTNQQKLTLQITELKNAGVHENHIFTDIRTDSIDKRERSQQLLMCAERDDTVLRTKMDRLECDTADIVI